MRKQNLGKKILCFILSLAMTLPFVSVCAQETNTEILVSSHESEMKSIILANNDIHIETNIDCFGNLVSNNSITFKNSTYDIAGSCTSGIINKMNSQGTITTESPSITTSSIPNLTKALDDEVKTVEATAQAVQLYAKHKIEKSEYGIDSISYIASNLSINGLIAANNDINIHSASVSLEQSDFAILYSQNGDINVSSSQISYNGIIYAPNGTVTMNSSNINFSGIIIAKNVTIFSSECTLSYHNGVEKYLPKQEPDDGQYEDCYEKPLQEDAIIVVETTGLMYVKNQLVLTAKDVVQKDEIAELAKQYNGTIVGYLAVSRNYQIEFTVDKSLEELENIVLDIQNSTLIEDCSTHMVLPFSFHMDGYSNTPNDPWNEDVKWDENNPSGNNWGLEAINARGAWTYKDKMTKVNVGIIDTKVLEHEDIEKVHILNDGKYKDPGEDEDSQKYHATNVAGVIGATHNNKIGINGVAPNVEIYNTPFLHQTKWFKQKFTINKELETLIVKEKVKIINASIGIPDLKVGICLENNKNSVPEYYQEDGIPWGKKLGKDNTEYSEGVANQLIDYVNLGYDFVIVQSAGNQSAKFKYDEKNNYGWLDTKYSGAFSAIEDAELKKRIIVVGALKNNDNGKYSVCDFNNVGTRIDIFAPGEEIYTTKVGDKYELAKGSSIAAPHVTGVAAMVWGINPQLTGEEVKDIIVNNYSITVKIPRQNPSGSINHVINENKVFEKNYPVLNAKMAVEKLTCPVYEIVLEWGNASPHDMDLYFKYPGADIGDNYVCFYQTKLYHENFLLAEYLNNAIHKPGKETIKIYGTKHGIHSCKVIAPRMGSENAIVYPNSDMTVTLYHYGQQIAKFTPSKDSGRGIYWHVFDIDDGKIIPINKVSS